MRVSNTISFPFLWLNALLVGIGLASRLPLHNSSDDITGSSPVGKEVAVFPYFITGLIVLQSETSVCLPWSVCPRGVFSRPRPTGA